ncbi:MAG TPA: hypothetical protein VE641_02460 [Chthoniobacterales bacterium]|nr:hypothetical protein [Chthoniobacterales bacterium]
MKLSLLTTEPALPQRVLFTTSFLGFGGVQVRGEVQRQIETPAAGARGESGCFSWMMIVFQ